MSAIVCGKRSILFDDFQSQSPSPSLPPVNKRIRLSFSPATSNFDNSIASLKLDHLLMVFSDMDKQEVMGSSLGNSLLQKCKCIYFFDFDMARVKHLRRQAMFSKSTELVSYPVESVKGELGVTVKFLPCDQEVTGSSLRNSLWQKCKLVEKALEECGDDLDSAIKHLNELRLGSGDNLRPVAGTSGATHDSTSQFLTQGVATNDGETSSVEDLSAAKVVHLEGKEWVELFVGEMMNASNIDDAKARASRTLEMLEKSICARATEEAAGFQQENMMLKQQLEALIQENAILKRAVSIQHERQKEYEDRGNELNQLKQSLAQYQEQLRTLEVNNYALSMHLKQAQQSNNSIPGRFNPDEVTGSSLGNSRWQKCKVRLRTIHLCGGALPRTPRIAIALVHQAALGSLSYVWLEQNAWDY
ncbi:putative TBC1 domain family member 15-like [Capsicum annuum]|nr:putative TBC1 domain family member 15-like [Capsicum annuum]